MKISHTFCIVAVYISTATAAVRDVHCFKSTPASWQSNCGDADKTACSGRCSSTCQTRNFLAMATSDGNCDCWCEG
ncbi:hypothetical protein CGMCC3_g13668 [Colletotrichum fructicola]|nr:uncharacterized protein CGMCC3_g13668 [Colletotrichum fructicola]KAE9570109.1 hypothetical protein CGMCC3_g13668 [Colletotrichum fructicola]